VVVLLIAIRRATLKTNFWCGSFFGWCAAVSVYYSTVCRIVEWCGGMVTEQCSRKLDFTKYSSAWEYSQQVTQQTKLKISKWGSQKVYSCWKCNNNIFGTSLTFVMSRSWQQFKDQKVNYIITWLITDLAKFLWTSLRHYKNFNSRLSVSVDLRMSNYSGSITLFSK
jgi:hypothetical protein